MFILLCFFLYVLTLDLPKDAPQHSSQYSYAGTDDEDEADAAVYEAYLRGRHWGKL